MTFIRSSLDIYFTVWKESLAYRFSMLFSIISGPLSMIVNYIIWKNIFYASGQTIISGYTFEQMITYIVIAFVTVYLTWDDVDQHYQKGVESGGFIIDLLKPISSLRYLFFGKLGHRSLAFFLEFIPVLFLMGLLFGFHIYKTNNITLYFISLAIAFVISFLLNSLIGMLAFWIVKPRGLMEIYNMLKFFLHGSLLPLSLFPEIIQKIFFFLPFQFVAYVPARIFMGDYVLGSVAFTPLEVVLYGLLQIGILSLILMLVWKKSIKRFCGVGA